MLGFLRRKKHWFQKPRIILVALIVVVIVAVVYVITAFGSDATPEEVVENKAVAVTVARVSDLTPDSEVRLSGVVKPATKVDVVALVGGTIQQLFFEIGDEVSQNAVLAQLYNASALTNLNNAVTNFNNTQLSTDATRRLAEDSVRQAEIGLQNAQEAKQSAAISLKAAQDNLDNSLALQDREVTDTYNNSVIAANDYLNIINNALDQVDFIIAAEEGTQLPGIEPTIAALDYQSLVIAERDYFTARERYLELRDAVISTGNITSMLPQVIANLEQAKTAVDSTIVVLSSTIPNPELSDSALLAQKNNYTTLRSTVVGKLTAAQATYDTLNNLSLRQKQQRDSLQAQVEVAKSQLELAELSVLNAQTSLEQARESRDSQIIGARSSLDVSRGQLTLAQNQVSDLAVSAPIGGQITAKHVELGAELTPGQRVAEISQSGLVKIEAELTSDEVYQIAVGDSVTINEDLSGTIVRIDPAADPVTRKVGVEIIFDNTNNELIPETFVDITIPLRDVSDSTTVMVPLKAVTITQREHFVYVVDDTNIARKQVVELGAIDGDQVAVLSGLTADDQLVIEGNKLLKDGLAVEIAD